MTLHHLRENDVVLYIRGTATHPADGHSARAVALLRETGVRFATANVDADDEFRDAVAAYSGWETFPQLFVQGQFIGGVEYMEEMARIGALQVLVRDLPKA